MTADNGNGTGPAVEAVRLRVDENVLTPKCCAIHRPNGRQLPSHG